MTALLADSELVIATHNPGKVREIADLLAPYLTRGGVQIRSAIDLDLDEPVEDGDSFAANALIKARAAALASGLPALADDSGLAVDALDGAPGIHSARLAGPTKDFALAMEKLHNQLAEKEAGANPCAKFVCVLALAWPDGSARDFRGEVAGTLVWPPRGTKGFGYDPIFVPTGYDQTFGEMEPTAKHAISHRANAFAKLVATLFQDDT